MHAIKLVDTESYLLDMGGNVIEFDDKAEAGIELAGNIPEAQWQYYEIVPYSKESQQ